MNFWKIEIIKEHNLGVNKYKSLKEFNDDWIIPDYNGVSDELMDQYKAESEAGCNVPVEVCKI